MDAAVSSLIDRAGLDKGKVRQLIGRGLEGADDGELFLEYRQAELLVFDNGRLKQATYDTAQGFGLRAVKDEAVGYAHASDVSEAALARAAEAVRAVKGGHSGQYAEPPGRTNRKLYGDENPLGEPAFDAKVKLLEAMDAYARAKDADPVVPRATPGAARAGAGGRARPARRHVRRPRHGDRALRRPHRRVRSDARPLDRRRSAGGGARPRGDRPRRCRAGGVAW